LSAQVLLLEPLCQLGGLPPPSFLTAHEAAALRQCGAFTHESWLLLLLHYAELGHKPGKQFELHAEQYFLGALHRLSPGELACYMSCSAKLGLVHNPQMEQRIVECTEQVCQNSYFQLVLRDLILLAVQAQPVLQLRDANISAAVSAR
jgi:hypothetical protein